MNPAPNHPSFHRAICFTNCLPEKNYSGLCGLGNQQIKFSTDGQNWQSFKTQSFLFIKIRQLVKELHTLQLKKISNHHLSFHHRHFSSSMFPFLPIVPLSIHLFPETFWRLAECNFNTPTPLFFLCFFFPALLHLIFPLFYVSTLNPSLKSHGSRLYVNITSLSRWLSTKFEGQNMYFQNADLRKKEGDKSKMKWEYKTHT